MFSTSLSALGFKPADLVALGLPRSTAYDWCSGKSTPDHSAFILTVLERSRPNKKDAGNGSELSVVYS